MSLSEQNRALIERVTGYRHPSADRAFASLGDIIDAARAEGPEPQTIPLGAKQAAIEALEPFAIALEHFKDPRPYLLLESFHRAAEALAMLRAEGRPSPEGEEAWRATAGELILAQTPEQASILYGPLSPAHLVQLLAERDALLLTALSTPSPERAEGATAGEVKGNLPADPASVLPVLAHLVATGEATAKQRAELAAALSQPSQGEQEIGDYQLHPKTAALVRRFMSAVAAKLAAAEVKYGYSDGWADPAWQDECRRQLHHHAAKGDPRDVAAYAAFCWHHGWSTAAPEPDLFAGNAKKPEPGYEAEPVGDWVMVPREPTEGILRAGFGNHYRLDTALGRERAADDYRAMFCALPAHDPVAEPVGWVDAAWDAGLAKIDPAVRELIAGPLGILAAEFVRARLASPVPVAISREELEQEISEAVLSASIDVPEAFGDRVAMRRTITKNTVDAILQRLSNQQGGGKGALPELPGVSAVQLPASTTAQRSDGGEG